MTSFVPRRCVELTVPDAAPTGSAATERRRSGDRDPTPRARAASRPLSAFRDAPAYVLLGDPGAGKTTAFESESTVLGDAAALISARNFLALDVNRWRGKTLFIDGLDEVRAGSPDARTPLDAIRGRLDTLDRPRYRLSCREADWLGSNDRRHLELVAPDKQLTVLHLEPLAETDVAALLENHFDIEDVAQFIKTARQQDLDGLLGNPQTLSMLAHAVEAGSDWPASRQETFEHACRQMVMEHNEEHCAARSAAAAAGRESMPDHLLNAAGFLCAVQLLSGVVGYTLHGIGDDDYPDLDACQQAWRSHDGGERSECAPLRNALGTKLFRAQSTGRFAPVHRHIAEFLAGRFLAQLIDRRASADRRPGSLPAGRAIALLTGSDGGVVTPLRGLSAWLAAHSQHARRDLIDRDPVGVGLYGDLHRFDDHERRALLAALQREAARLAFAFQTAAAFTALATPAMANAFRAVLTDTRRDSDHRDSVYFILSILWHGSPPASLDDVLLRLARDDTWPAVIRDLALEALTRHPPYSTETTDALRALLAEIRERTVFDPNQELRCILLRALYPDHLSPADVWEHWPSSTAGRSISPPEWRLTEHVAQCPDAHTAEHLDRLAARIEPLRIGRQPGLMPPEPWIALLARGLEAHGDDLETPRLYKWLGVGLDGKPDNSSETAAATGRIRAWLEARGEVIKAVFAEEIRRCAAASDHDRFEAAFDVWARLYSANLPSDFGRWCLNQAAAATDRRIAAYYLRHVFDAVGNGETSLTIEQVIEKTNAHPALKAVFNEESVCPVHKQLAMRRQNIRHQRRIEGERRERLRPWVDEVRSHADALRANHCPPPLLHQLALMYFGHTSEAHGESPRKRLAGALQDSTLVDAALAALRGALHRDDLPDVDAIVRLREQNLQHWLALPCLASFAERSSATDDPSSPGTPPAGGACRPTDSPAGGAAPSHRPLGDGGDGAASSRRPNDPPDVAVPPYRSLDDRALRALLAFHYTGAGVGEPPGYRAVVATRPQLAADVLLRCARAGLRTRRAHVHGPYALANDSNHAQVARIVSLPLLAAFPVRSAAHQTGNLQYLLRAALQHADGAEFAQLIATRLAKPSLNLAQRACWLAAGLVVAPETHLPAVNDFTAASERRIRHLAAAVDDAHWPGSFVDRLDAPALQVLVQRLGSSFGPSRPDTDEAYEVTLDIRSSDLVRRMIERLSALPSAKATKALDALAQDALLSPWRWELNQARYRQRVVARDAAHRPPTVAAVCRTLDDGPPANAADLAALVVDRLDEVAKGIRTGNTNDWRQYWNEAHTRQPDKPKHEESCRDALLSDLRMILPEEVDAQPEGRYANDKRADIRVSYRDFNVPVEIKKHTHRDLWSAAQNQLMARYTSDPATDWHGVYVVLWFGEESDLPKSPDGARLATPDALRERLEADLTPAEARRITVRVIDVSRGAGTDRPK